MDNLTLKNILSKAEKKKISYNVNEKTLEMVDELAGILGASRSQMLDSLIVSGIWAHTTFSIKTWESEKKKKEYRDRIEKIEEIIKKMKEFRKRWNISDRYYVN